MIWFACSLTPDNCRCFSRTSSPKSCTPQVLNMSDPETNLGNGKDECNEMLCDVLEYEEHVATIMETDKADDLVFTDSVPDRISESDEPIARNGEIIPLALQLEHKTIAVAGEGVVENLEPEPGRGGDQETQSVAPATLSRFRTTLFNSVKDISETISNLVWDDYRFPRAKSKLQVDGTSTQVNYDVAVGRLSIHLIDAYRTDVKDAADGDYFATCAVTDLNGPAYHNGVLLEEDTHTVCNSAAPVFNCIFEFEVPHFRCGVRLLLVDATTGKKIGTSVVSVYSLIQVC